MICPFGAVDALVIGEAKPGGQLPHAAGRHLELVKVIVVFIERLLPREQHPLPVVRHVGVAEHAAGIIDQRANLPEQAVHGQEAEARAGHKCPLVLRVGLPLGVGVVRAAQIVVLGEDDPPPFFQQV